MWILAGVEERIIIIFNQIHFSLKVELNLKKRLYRNYNGLNIDQVIWGFAEYIYNFGRIRMTLFNDCYTEI